MKRGSILLGVIAVIIVIILAFSAWIIFNNGKIPLSTVLSVATTTPSIMSLYNLPTSTTPLGIPSDLPSPPDAQIIFNGSISNSSSSPSSTQESVRGYTTSETVDQIYAPYASYFSSQSSTWNVISELSQGSVRSIDAQSKNYINEVIVTISQGKATQKTAVNIEATYQPVLTNDVLTIQPKQIR